MSEAEKNKSDKGTLAFWIILPFVAAIITLMYFAVVAPNIQGSDESKPETGFTSDEERSEGAIDVISFMVTSYLTKHPTADNLQWEFEHGKASLGSALGDDPDWLEQVRGYEFPETLGVYIQKTENLADRTPGTWKEYTIIVARYDYRTGMIPMAKYDSKTKKVTAYE